MRKQTLKIFTFLSAFFCAAALGAFYPVNHGMINQSTQVTNSFTATNFVATQNQVYIHSGAAWQIDVLADATHLPLDWWYDIVNNSSSYITVQDNGFNNIASVNAGEIGHFWSKGNGSNVGNWKFNVQTSANDLVPLPVSIANGGSGSTTKAAAFNALSPTSSKGDIIVNNGSANVAFGACPNGQQVTYDSTQSTGIKCVASAANPLANITATSPVLYDNVGFVISLLFTPMKGANNLSEITVPATARTNLGLGTLALSNVTLGTVATENTANVLQTAYALADVAAPAARTNLGLGVLATQNSVSIGSFSASPSAPGLTYTNNNLNMDPADATHPGGVSILAQSYAGKKTFTNGLDASTNQITNVTDPTTAQMAATKNYVDTQINQLNPAAAVVGATTANIAATYTNAVGGVCIGDTLQITSTSTFTVDGVTPTVGQRFLFKNQNSTFQDGVWTLTTAANVGVLGALFTRALDSDSASDFNAGQIVPVVNGTVNAGSSWYQTAAITTCNSDAQTWTQFQKASSAYLLVSNNLSDVVAATARTNLGLGTVATENTASVLQTAYALADVAAPAARTNLGLGTVATENTASVLQTAYALADIVASAGRTNLGLGALATENIATVGQTTIQATTLSTCTTARTVDWSTGYSFAITLTSGNACTLSFTNATLGQQIQIALTNGSGGGTATVVWPTAKWFPAGAPTMTTGTGAVDLCACTYMGFFACNCLQNGG